MENMDSTVIATSLRDRGDIGTNTLRQARGNSYLLRCGFIGEGGRHAGRLHGFRAAMRCHARLDRLRAAGSLMHCNAA